MVSIEGNEHGHVIGQSDDDSSLALLEIHCLLVCTRGYQTVHPHRGLRQLAEGHSPVPGGEVPRIDIDVMPTQQQAAC